MIANLLTQAGAPSGYWLFPKWFKILFAVRITEQKPQHKPLGKPGMAFLSEGTPGKAGGRSP